MSSNRRLALVMGVANKRSIAWACVQSLLDRDYDCVITYQSDRFDKPIQRLIDSLSPTETGQIIGALPCAVEAGIPKLLQHDVKELLKDDNRKFDAMIHSLAYSDMTKPRLSQATWPVFAQAMQISAYSFLEMTRIALESDLLHAADSKESSSLVALSYLGAVRAAPNYQCMGK